MATASGPAERRPGARRRPQRAGARAQTDAGTALDAQSRASVPDAEALDAFQRLLVLSQQHAVFQQRLRQDRSQFQLKLVVAWTSYALLFGFSLYILCNEAAFDSSVTTISAGAIVAQTAWLCIWMLRGVSKRGSDDLAPVTRMPPPRGTGTEQQADLLEVRESRSGRES